MTSMGSLYSLNRTLPQDPRRSRTPGIGTEQNDFGAVLAAVSGDPAQSRSTDGKSVASAVSTAPQAPEFIGTRRLTDVDRAVYADIHRTFQLPQPAPGGLTILSDKPLMPWMLSGASGKTITGDLLTSNLDKATDIFRRHFGSWMSREGVSTTPPIQLSVASDGRVVTQADHPDKARIESFINDNGELRNLFVGITSTKSLIEIGRESIAFQARYAVDPKAAVAEYSHFFTGSYTYETILSIGNTDWSLVSTPHWSIA